MQKEIKPIEYEKIITNAINEVYKNFQKNVSKDFIVPETIQDLFKQLKEIKSKKDLDTFGLTFDKSFPDWKPAVENSDQLIMLNHLMSIFQNAAVVIMSIDNNLEEEKLPKGVVSEMGGLDIIVTTTVQAFGVKANELIKAYEERVKNDSELNMYENIHNSLKKIINIPAEQAFRDLVQNLVDFFESYFLAYKKLSEAKEINWTKDKIDMLMDYVNSFYLLALFMRLVLTYPKQEGLMTEEVFNRIVPNINIY
ncbi:hypothetical protein [Spiroplasma tabanidicola]|uniref:Uncharacterized protein n=1 Tax=Spiroplasma tabanidicola TaxID=324079 RepID=A0A6I6CA28_9MOLU|nr:hypothetical protein [Spiroplasma tabanidicola]QGS52406.1 hypothetical protein STABA_v1c10580 [Spiroplasma tabanidicola]